MNGGSCFATAAAYGGGVKCLCADGYSGERCEMRKKTRVSVSGDTFDWSFVPRFHGQGRQFSRGCRHSALIMDVFFSARL